jgi:hypothetical protein
MYDNQMSVFSKQMDCEPKLQECSKRSDSMKLQVLLLLLLLLLLLGLFSAAESRVQLFCLLFLQSKLH